MKKATLTDGLGTLTLVGGNLRMTKASGDGPGIYARKNASQEAIWGATNTYCSYGGASWEVPTRKILELTEKYIEHGGWW